MPIRDALRAIRKERDAVGFAVVGMIEDGWLNESYECAKTSYASHPLHFAGDRMHCQIYVQIDKCPGSIGWSLVGEYGSHQF